MKKKILVTTAIVIMVLVLTVVLTACFHVDIPTYSYESAYARAQELGYSGSFSDFEAALSNAKGDNDADIKSIITENNYLIIVLSDGNRLNLGKIKKESYDTDNNNNGDSTGDDNEGSGSDDNDNNDNNESGNTGDDNTGDDTGDNTGDNTGDDNTGDDNTGGNGGEVEVTDYTLVIKCYADGIEVTAIPADFNGDLRFTFAVEGNVGNLGTSGIGLVWCYDSYLFEVDIGSGQFDPECPLKDGQFVNETIPSVEYRGVEELRYRGVKFVATGTEGQSTYEHAFPIGEVVFNIIDDADIGEISYLFFAEGLDNFIDYEEEIAIVNVNDDGIVVFMLDILK